MGEDLVGTRVGHIRLERRLGHGGMGEVYLGYDERLQRPVAVKALREDRRLGTVARARLLREARALSQLDHPGICRIHDLAEGESFDSLVLEYIDGETLGRAAFSRFDESEKLRVVVDVARSLEAAHRVGIVHRDLKPDNVMLTRDGQVKVLDFGIARSVGPGLEVVRRHGVPTLVEVDDAATRAGTEPLTGFRGPDRADGTAPVAGESTQYTGAGEIVGTIRYMSPEQAAGEPVTVASDMYAFGILVQELFTGRPAYGEAKGVDLLLKVYRAEALPAEGVDPDLAALLERVKRIDPANRPTASETVERLTWIRGRPGRARARRLRFAVAAAFAAVVVISGLALVRTRVLANRRAAVAQRLAQQAVAVEWLLRAEHLSPPHDLRPAKQEVRRRMGLVEDQMGELGAVAVGPGALALGRGHLALGDARAARRELERAWGSGYRLPEVAYALGLALGELYRQELGGARMIANPELRAAAIARAQEELRRPALAMLTQEGVSQTTVPEYVEALIAGHEERFDEALARARVAVERAPWLYEAEMVSGDVLVAKSAAAVTRSDGQGEVRALGEALDHYRAAAEIARSDPEAAARVCVARRHLAWSQQFTLREPMPAETLRDAAASCDRALALDPELAEAWTAKAVLLQLEGRRAAESGEDPAPAYREAMELATRAVELEPGIRTRTARGMVYLVQAEFEANHGRDCTASFAGAIGDLTFAVERSPNDIAARTRLAETYTFLAGAQQERGQSPVESLESGIAVLEQAISAPEVPSTVYFTLGGLYFYRARWEALHGLDAGESFDRAVAAYRTAAAGSSRTVEFANLGLVLMERGEYLTSRGEDPTPSYRDGVEQARRAIEISPRFGFVHFVEGLNHLGLARFAYLQGGDPRPELGHAVRCYRTGLELQPSNAYAYPELAVMYNLEADHDLASGRSPEVAIEGALAALATGLELSPGFAGTHRVAGETGLLRARWQLHQGRSPEEDLRRAAASLARAGELNALDPETPRATAELHLWRARWQRARPEAVDREVAAGLEAAARALGMNPRLAEAELVRAALHRTLAEAVADEGVRRTAGAEATAALDRARRVTPWLRPHLAALAAP